MAEENGRKEQIKEKSNRIKKSFLTVKPTQNEIHSQCLKKKKKKRHIWKKEAHQEYGKAKMWQLFFPLNHSITDWSSCWVYKRALKRGHWPGHNFLQKSRSFLLPVLAVFKCLVLFRQSRDETFTTISSPQRFALLAGWLPLCLFPSWPQVTT